MARDMEESGWRVFNILMIGTVMSYETSEIVHFYGFHRPKQNS